MALYLVHELCAYGLVCLAAVTGGLPFLGSEFLKQRLAVGR